MTEGAKGGDALAGAFGRPVHFVGGISRHAACGAFRSFRIHYTDQIGQITCRKCLTKMKARSALLDGGARDGGES